MPFFRSVRSRLLLMVTAVILVALAAVAWSSRRVTRQEFGQFVQRLETQIETGAVSSEATLVMGPLASLGVALQDDYRTRGDWRGAAGIMDARNDALDGRVAVVIAGGEQVVAASDPQLTGAQVDVSDAGHVQIRGWNRARADGTVENQVLAFRGPSRPLRAADGEQVAVLYILPAPGAEDARRRIRFATGQDFLGSLDRWMLGVVVIVGVLALVATMAMSGRIVGPIERLTEASRRMGQGDLGHRVEVGSNDEIGELAAAFNSMAESLAHHERLRRDMVSDVAHELRTPLTNLRGQLEAVQDGLSEPTPQLIASLHEETMLLNRLIDDLQELALAEAGQLRLEFEEIDVAAEIARAKTAFERRASELRGEPGPGGAASIRTTVDDGLPPARGDVQRFRQILGNLLDNAVGHGGTEIEVTAEVGPAASSAAEPGSGSVRVTVGDNGPGIPREQQADVFERFYRTDPSRQRATGGAGLGLAIVRQLVEAQGGEVSLESEPGVGSTFGFSLPAADS